jgi:hypothetical protein
MEGMTPFPREDPAAGLAAEERTFQRRRLLVATALVVALTAVAGGSALGAVASAQDDRAVGVSQHVAVTGP